MAEGLTDIWVNQALGATLRGTAFPVGSFVYIGLSTTTPSVGLVPNFTEPGVGGYARVQVPAAITSFASLGVGSRAFTSSIPIQFPAALSSWGTVTHAGVFEEPGLGGNLVAFGAFSAPLAIPASYTLIIPAGELTLSVT